MMLFGFGDAPKSLDSTKKVLDEILSDFVIELCHEAAVPAQLAGRQKIKVDDFKFACRKDPLKLGKIEEVFEKKKKIDDARNMTSIMSDEKLSKRDIKAMAGKEEEPLGEKDDDEFETQTIGGRSTGTGRGR